MKKTPTFIILLFCTSAFATYATSRSYDEMVSIAEQHFLRTKSFPTNSTTNSFFRHTFHPQIEFVDSSSAYSIFNLDKNFVVVSSDNRLPPVLGYGREGKLDPHNIPPALSVLLSQYDKELLYLNSISSTEPIKLKDPASSLEDSVAPLLKTKWGQQYPFNKLTPKEDTCQTLTGCIAVAMAQVMNYYKYPKKGKGTTSYKWKEQTLSSNFENSTYTWEYMLDKYETGKFDSIQATAVATLMSDCGIASNMNYGCTESGANMMIAIPSLQQHFDYDQDVQLLNKDYLFYDSICSIIRKELKQKRPVFCSATNDNNSNESHAFVLDGFDNNGFFHINWGWQGESDGFYLLSALNPTNQNYHFNTTVSFFIGIQPKTDKPNPSMGHLYDEINFSDTCLTPTTRCTCTITSTSFNKMTGSYSLVLYDELGAAVQELVVRPNKDLAPGTQVTISFPCQPYFASLPKGLYILRSEFVTNTDTLKNIPCLKGDNYKTIKVSDSSICLIHNLTKPNLILNQTIQLPNQYQQNRKGDSLMFSIKNEGAIFQGELQARILNATRDDSIGIYASISPIIKRDSSFYGTLQNTFETHIENNTKYYLSLFWREDSTHDWLSLSPTAYDTVSFKVFAPSKIIYDTTCSGYNYQQFDFNMEKTHLVSNDETTIDSLRIIPLTQTKDSVVLLHLTLLPTYDIPYYDTICLGDSFEFNGHFYSSTGIYSDTLVTYANCDSIVTLHLSTLADTQTLIVNINETTPLPYQYDEYFAVPQNTKSDSTFFIKTTQCSYNKYEVKLTRDLSQIETTQTNPIKIEILDCLGNTLQTHTMPTPFFENLHLSNGVYLLRYLYSNGSIKIKKHAVFLP